MAWDYHVIALVELVVGNGALPNRVLLVDFDSDLNDDNSIAFDPLEYMERAFPVPQNKEIHRLYHVVPFEVLKNEFSSGNNDKNSKNANY